MISANPDDTGPAPFPDLCRSSPNAPARADHEQGLAGSELSIFNQAEPSGEVGHTYRRRLLEGQRLGLAPKARDWDGNQFRMATIDRIADLAAGAPDLHANPFDRAVDDRAGIVAPGHAGHGRMLHLPLDILHIAGADRAGRDLDDRCCGIGLRLRQLDQS